MKPDLEDIIQDAGNAVHAGLASNTTTSLPPCSLEVNTIDDTLFVGCYQLEDDRSRNGSIDIYNHEL
jgi:hypothetical protein